MRTEETVDRKTWEAMLEADVDGETAEVLRDVLGSWQGGDNCESISVRLDSLGRLDSMSSPHPE